MTAGKKLIRFLKLGRMTASVAGHYLGGRITESLSGTDRKKQHARVADEWAGKRIAKTLGELKGPLMKIGQMASISSGLLPKELSDALAVLRKDAPFAPFERIAEQIEKELGAPTNRLFASFDEKPCAAASIGQVHRAVLDDGRLVAVKVQYSDIEDSVDADIAQLRLALKAAGMMRKSRHLFDKFFEDISVQLREELDYCNEADNIRLIRDFHKSRCSFLHIPDVVEERSTKKVLTMTFEGGDALEIASNYPSDIRDLIGRRLVSNIYSQILEQGALHADPNPANFAFRPNGDIVLYDFGSVKKFEESEQVGVRTLLSGILNRDAMEVATGFVQVGMIDDLASLPDLAVFDGAIRLLAPVMEKGAAFDFSRSRIHREVIDLWPKIRKHGGSFHLTAAMMMIQRVNVGTYGNLRRLGARVNVRDAIDEILCRGDSSR
jgi:predicted unusual protein kinase regulating ubiquinone biosynthesis (AarF/ABC1/UbiB family)